MGAFRYVLYAAVAVSLCVYAYRAYKRWFAPDREPGEAGSGTDAATPTGASAASTTRPAKPPAVKRGFGFTDPNSLPSEREAANADSLVQQVIREEVARKQAGEAPETSGTATATGRGGLFASAASAPSPDRASVAAALTGVRLPDDLVPLVGDGIQTDAHHVTFISSSASAAAIGQHLGDDLERLGYEVRTETDTVAVATKGAVTLRVTLHPDAGTERVDGAARFPTAAANSVVVEFET